MIMENTNQTFKSLEQMTKTELIELVYKIRNARGDDALTISRLQREIEELILNFKSEKFELLEENFNLRKKLKGVKNDG